MEEQVRALAAAEATRILAPYRAVLDQLRKLTAPAETPVVKPSSPRRPRSARTRSRRRGAQRSTPSRSAPSPALWFDHGDIVGYREKDGQVIRAMVIRIDVEQGTVLLERDDEDRAVIRFDQLTGTNDRLEVRTTRGD